MWMSRGCFFNGRVPCCVLALPHWLSGRDGGHFSHYSSPPVRPVKDGQNQYTYSNKDSDPQNQCHLFDQRLFTQARAECARMPFLSEMADLHCDSGI